MIELTPLRGPPGIPDIRPPGPRCWAVVSWVAEISGAPLLREDVACLATWRLVMAAFTERLPLGPVSGRSIQSYLIFDWAVEVGMRTLWRMGEPLRIQLDDSLPTEYGAPGIASPNAGLELCKDALWDWMAFTFHDTQDVDARKERARTVWREFYQSEAVNWGGSATLGGYKRAGLRKRVSIRELFDRGEKAGVVPRTGTRREREDALLLDLLASTYACGRAHTVTPDGRLIYNFAGGIDEATPERRRRQASFERRIQSLDAALPTLPTASVDDQGDDGDLQDGHSTSLGPAASDAIEAACAAQRLDALRRLESRVRLLGLNAIRGSRIWDLVCESAWELYVVELAGRDGERLGAGIRLAELARRGGVDRANLRKRWIRLRDTVIAVDSEILALWAELEAAQFGG